ncbi:SDR family NAD(P)-dependent oxidoreductase [Streptomyces sp. NBC_00038]|uniref:SDR family NAD(P)-dependent oxidoreductase n=1 Tax=Streptomyces sp. NBC_00038 TaxID=2903615 RepID=UPI00225400D5|nr:SDR family NAD(P)-dependent oxidoreductase [Streptomyces sp. NBC_00038]MCX5563514.1 SDR family oxidoreductase [Streptomyces sp. NBC_00038]
MTGRLEGKVALITGTASGMGRAAAVRFAQEGALVIGCDLSEDGNRETVELVAETGAKMTGMAPVDLGDPEAARTWVEESAAVHGRIDVVFNNASSPRFAPLPDLSVEDWRYAMRNELDLVFYVTKFAWPHLAERGGVVINTASTSAYVATPGQGFAAHCAAKGGVLAFTRQVASDGAPHGIRALSISPGAIKTPVVDRNYLSKHPGAEQELIDRSLIATRMGTPEDVASLAVFAASDEAGYLTGVDLLIDGGMTAL